MHATRLLTAGLWVFVALRASGADNTAPATEPAPKPSGLTESVEKRLVQLDVGVEGDPAAIRALKAEDFTLYVGEHEVQGLILDRLCDTPAPAEAEAPAEASGEAQTPVVAPPATRARATFVFYFDQPHLTMMGRADGLDTAQELINRLVVDGNRASIVSSARSVQTIVAMTGDRDKLQAGLKKLRADLRQWDSYAATEEGRARQIVLALTESMKCLVAQSYAREEWEEARQSTERIGFTVGALAEVPMPKALVYFGDNLRQSAGLHFLRLGCDSQPAVLSSAQLIPSAATEFDSVIKEALARGVHFFTIQAEGIGVYDPGWDTWRHHEAQDALVGLAAETGGEAFLGGASTKYIGGRIAARSSCSLLLSFPPGDLPRDTPLAVTLVLHVPRVKLRTQGRIVLPSPQSIERARLLAAFSDPAASDDGSLRALLIPRGGDGKTWRTTVQLRLRASGLPDTSAELGASIVRTDKSIVKSDKVSNQFASSIATRIGTRPLVLEKSLELAPGDFFVVAVAHDVNRGDIASSRVEASLPNPAKTEAAIAPIAVLQNGAAAISKDGDAQSFGSLARDVDELLDASAAISLASVVCRGAKTKGSVIVERRLEDGAPNDFLPMTIDEAGDPCVETVDVVRAGRLKPGVVDYRIVARIGDDIVASERRTLRVGAAGGHPGPDR